MLTYDVWSRLLKERIICLNGPVDDQSSAGLVASLLYLEADNPEKPISFYINSGGGSVTSGMAIYDTMQYIQSEVSTICLGQAASMASLLLCAGAKGRRYCLPVSLSKFSAISDLLSLVAAFLNHDTPTIRRIRWAGNRYCHSSKTDTPCTRAAEQYLQDTFDRQEIIITGRDIYNDGTRSFYGCTRSARARHH